MLKFVVRRVLWTIPIILLVIFMTFWMMRAIKGSPFRRSEQAPCRRRCSRTSTASSASTSPGTSSTSATSRTSRRFDFGPSLVLRDQSVNDIVQGALPGLGGARRLRDAARDRSSASRSGSSSALRANKLTDYMHPCSSRTSASRSRRSSPRRSSSTSSRRSGGGSRRTAGTRRARRCCPSIALSLVPAHVLRAARARPDARDAAAGLRAHGEGEGPALAARRRRARPAQLADPRA